MVRMFVRSAVITVACLLSVPLIASAQSVIAGEVRDESGAVLPGVTVEVASSALIEGSRTVTTNASGQYRVVDLRPGTYTVTFTLEGFSMFKREGVDLPSSFTATVNADLKIGSLQETLTVSGQASTVDVQQVTRNTVLSRALVDALPTTRNIMSVGQLVPGLRQAVADVGGSRLMEQTNIFGHGVNGRNTAYFLDGLRINANKQEGGIIQYQNDALNQEVVVSTSASPAEIGVAGVAVNTIPKDGGNTFSGGAFLSFTNGDWMSDNVNDELRARNIRSGNNVDRIDNDQVSQGGPIVRNKLWFFAAGGYTKADETVANSPSEIQIPDGTMWKTTNTQWVNNVLLRLTGQLTPKNKLAGMVQRTFKKKDREYTNGQDPYYTSQWRPEKNAMYSIVQAKWTSTVSSRLLLDAGYSTNTIFYRIESQPWADYPKYLSNGSINPAWLGNARINDTALNPHRGCLMPEGCTTAGTFGQSQGEYARANTYASSATYVTGSHAVKGGVQLWRGPYRRQVQRQADLDQNYVNGVPQTVTVYNTPIDHEEFLDYALGFFIQDSWKLKRLTVNPGLRMESFSASIKEAHLPEGRFRPAIVFPALENMPPNWKHDFAPRLSAAYDLTGDGKTALKASIGKYFTTYITAFAATYSPAPQVSESRNWFDADLIPGTSTRSGRILPTNNDQIAQDNEIGPSGNPNFGLKGADRTFDPAMRKQYSWETTVTVQRELLPGLSVGVGYFHRAYRNLVVTDRTQITSADYTSFQVKVPDVSNDPDVAAVIDPNEIITVYNLNPAKRSVYGAALLDANSQGQLGPSQDQSIYNALEANVEARGANGRAVVANWTMERNVSVFCDTNDNPNGLPEGDLYTGGNVSRGGRFCDQRNFDIPFSHQFKISGNTPLVYGVSAAATFQGYPGLPRVITWQPAAALFPGGRTNAETIILNTPGSLFYPRYTQLDVNVRKTFRMRGKSITGQLDIFNVLNAGAIFSENNSVGASLGQVTSILQGRMPRLSVRMEW